MHDERFRRALYTSAGTARFVGMHPSTLAAWTAGDTRTGGGPETANRRAVVTCLEPAAADRRVIPFIGLVEATVVQAFRRTGLPIQRILRALTVLAEQGELEHALASEHLFSDGAEVLYDYAARERDRQLRLLTVVSSGQRVFHEIIRDYLERITFRDTWAGTLILPVTERPLLRVTSDVAAGDPIFVNGGAPLSAVRQRVASGESLDSVAADFAVPADNIAEAIDAIWPEARAA